jgi:8-oxo-dGTP pyrophosphatase MutT (NUDIX family)
MTLIDTSALTFCFAHYTIIQIGFLRGTVMLIDKVALLHWQDGKILSSRSKGKDSWYLPGGKREGSESDVETLIREIQEELSVSVDPETAVYYGTFEAQAHGKAEGITVRMTCYTAGFSGTPFPSHEIEELKWLTYQDKDVVSPVDKLIFDDLHMKGYLR